nr:YwqJ-related putative deaminase [Streptomyces mexicanus]
MELLEQDYAALKADAGHVRDTGRDVHNRFQGLSAYYTAPEAEQLFATTKPVKDRADTFADGLETVSGALAGYATEIRPLVKKLEDLKREATTFVASVKDDDDWEYDGDKVAHHNRIRDEVTKTVAAFWAAERTCHNKITALWHGTQMVAGDGSDKANQYGFNAEDLKNAKLPWGDPVEEKHHWYEVGHWVKSFVWDGLIVDGVWGTIKGLGTLVGFGGWEAMGQAWKGLAQLATGLAISSIPGVGAMFWALPDDKLPSWIRDSRTAMKETGKALVAWDEWGKNPARAAGAVTFNVLTTVFTGGAGGAASGAGKAGAVAKVLSAAGKAGRVIDPMTYVSKAAGAGLSKIGDIAKGLKGLGKIDIPELPDNAITLPEGSLKLPDGTVHLPEGTPIPQGATKLPNGAIELPHDAPVLPEGTTKLPSVEGSPAQYMDPHGNLLDHQGNVVQHAEQAPTDIIDKPHPEAGTPATGADTPHTPSPVRQPAMATAGAHTTEQAGAHIRLDTSLDHDLGDIGRTADKEVVHAGGEGVSSVHVSGDNIPSAHAGGDGASGGHTPNHASGSHAGDHLPGGSAHGHAAGPSASHAAPNSHTEGGSRPSDGAHGHPSTQYDDQGAHGHTSDGGGDTHGPSGEGTHGVAAPFDHGEVVHQDGAPPHAEHVAHPFDDFRVDDNPLPPPGPGEKVLGDLPESRVQRTEDGLISHVDGRPATEFLDNLSHERALGYLQAKQTGTFPRAQTGACVGSVVDLRTGRVVEGINGPKGAAGLLPMDRLHPTLLERYEQIADAPPHRAPILAHAEVKATNELLWARRKLGLPDDASALAEMRASVQFPFQANPETGAHPRPAPFCGNCNHMLEGMPSSYGRFLKDPPGPENWIP